MGTFHKVSRIRHCVLLAVTCLLSNVGSIQVHRNDTVSNQNVPTRLVGQVVDLDFMYDMIAKDQRGSPSADKSSGNAPTNVKTEVNNLKENATNRTDFEESKDLVSSNDTLRTESDDKQHNETENFSIKGENFTTTSELEVDSSTEYPQTDVPPTDDPSTDDPPTENSPTVNSSTDNPLTDIPQTENPVITQFIQTTNFPSEPSNISSADNVSFSTLDDQFKLTSLDANTTVQVGTSPQDTVNITQENNDPANEMVLTSKSTPSIDNTSPQNILPNEPNDDLKATSSTTSLENNTYLIPTTQSPKDSLTGSPNNTSDITTVTDADSKTPLFPIFGSQSNQSANGSLKPPEIKDSNKDELNINSVNENSSLSTPIPKIDDVIPQLGVMNLDENLKVTQSNDSSGDEIVSMIGSTTKNNITPLQNIFPSEPQGDSNAISITTISPANSTSLLPTTPSSRNPLIDTLSTTLNPSDPLIDSSNDTPNITTVKDSDPETNSPLPIFDSKSNQSVTESLEPSQLADLCKGRLNTTSVNKTSPPVSTPNLKTDDGITTISLDNHTTLFSTTPSPGNPSVGGSNETSNIMTIPVTEANTRINESSTIDNNKDHADSNKTKEIQCPSNLQSSLIDSFSKIVTDIGKNIISLFIDTLDKTFTQVINQIFPSIRHKISSALNDLRIYVDQNTTPLIDDAFETILDKKSSILQIVQEVEFSSAQNITNELQNTTKYQLNDTILEIFKEIEQFLLGLDPMQQEPHNFTLLGEETTHISVLIGSTVYYLLHNINATANDELASSSAPKNTSLEMLKLVNNYLENRQLDSKQFFDNKESFSELISDLIKLTLRYKNNFVKEMDYALVDLIIKADNEKQSFDGLLKMIFNVLKDLEDKLIKIKINQLKSTKIIQDSNQFEKSSLLKIEKVLNSTSEENNFLSNLTHSINKSLHDSMKIARVLFEELKNVSENIDDGLVIMVKAEIESSLFNVLFGLQKEFPPLFEIQFYNTSSSLNMSGLDEAYKNILENAFECLSLSENGRIDDRHDKLHTEIKDSSRRFENFASKPEIITSMPDLSTSAGLLEYPFQYLLVMSLAMICIM